MTAADAKDYFTKQPDDPATGWLTPTRMRSGIDVIYADMLGVQSILSGTASPGPGDGDDGDFYIDTLNGVLYGPKASGTWPAGTSLVGPTGAELLYGAVAPTTEGDDGDVYIDTATGDLYTKASGLWSLAVNITGPTGATGAQGDPGPGLAAGGTAGQVAIKNSGTDYDTAWADRWIVPVSTKTGTYTATAADQVLVCSGTFTVTLPAASTAGLMFQIKNKGTGIITVDGAGAETIDDQASIQLAQYEGVTVVSDGTEWWIL